MGRSIIVSVEKMQNSQRFLMRKQDELSSTVSTKVIDFEQKLIRMLPIPDNIPQYNLIKSQMEKEIRKLKNEITNNKKEGESKISIL